MSRHEALCHRCGFPARRGRLPIIWRSDETGTGRAAFCSVACLEAAARGRLPEPNRSLQLAVEAGK